MPCQAGCASGRAGNGRPQEGPVIPLQPLEFLPKPQHAACPLQEPSCAQDRRAVRQSRKEGRAGHTAGDGQTEATSALHLMGLIFGDHNPLMGGKRCPMARGKGRKGLCVALVVFLMPQAAGVGAAPLVPTGWTGHRGCLQGWWHRPGRLEALSVYPAWSGKPWQLSQQSALLSTLLPGRPSLGSLCVRHPTGLGHTQSQHGAKAKPSPSQEPATPG